MSETGKALVHSTNGTKGYHVQTISSGDNRRLFKIAGNLEEKILGVIYLVYP